MVLRLSGFSLGQPGWAGTRRNRSSTTRGHGRGSGPCAKLESLDRVVGLGPTHCNSDSCCL